MEHNPHYSRGALKVRRLQRLRSKQSEQWNITDLLIQRSLVCLALGSLGRQIATILSNEWCNDVVCSWGFPPEDQCDSINNQLSKFGLERTRPKYNHGWMCL
jgi:hypothetical protein